MEPYQGINAYVFVSDAHETDLTRLRTLQGGTPGVRAVGVLSGPFDAIAAVSTNDLAELRRIVVEEIRGGESPRTDTAIALPPFPPKVPMSPDLPPVVAFVRARLQRGTGSDALAATEDLPGFVGAVLVAGSFDMLVEFGGSDVDEVAAVLTGPLQDVPGIVSTVTSFADEVVQLA